ncbi:hypothetical protein TVAG_357170 [Trichomonas vaginalis G3]|uniref:Uncharacterized protein n=1 Tax=Trichomonas vaginalis (strain ATCC PRA-98 / G3) TaxID=412133 RepID=A2FWC9_TRIV3|nr:hypothetical protein TVAGG3_0668760 [Trichomonas vaginalis G3]EAX90793.1 hypothetical protein TVAG_357170 [Trichomonas vaginalis G3]KAI5507038.1 hypothetical protein TVAGG3_0668760 [Trichomonas vaginalis G3]|eukprot:XP_001303723.1 hypothetical protein [Trichomonas vaginalis G3]
MEDVKANLMKTYTETWRQINSVKLLLEKKQAECDEIHKKMKLAQETYDLAMKINLADLESEMHVKEMLVLKAETLAARENSLQNSTPEAREINSKIEQTFDEVYKIEAVITQSKSDISTYQQDIETIEKEHVEKREQSSKKIASIYKNIQNLREEVSQFRSNNLSNLISVQNDELNKEIEVQTSQTISMLFTEFFNSANAVTEALKNPDSASDVIKAEIEKCKILESKIPKHQAEKSYDDIMEMQEKTNILFQQINSFEDQIKLSINDMKNEEEHQDQLANNLKIEQRNSKELMQKLGLQETKVTRLEQEIKHLKEEDATRKDTALAKLEQLRMDILNIIAENRKKMDKINQLRSGSASKLKFNSPIENLCMSIHEQAQELNKEVERLTNEEEQLKSELNKLNLE